jgi:hypothetical protein
LTCNAIAVPKRSAIKRLNCRDRAFGLMDVEPNQQLLDSTLRSTLDSTFPTNPISSDRKLVLAAPCNKAAFVLFPTNSIAPDRRLDGKGFTRFQSDVFKFPTNPIAPNRKQDSWYGTPSTINGFQLIRSYPTGNDFAFHVPSPHNGLCVSN